MVPVVMVSSTAVDLREYREQVQHACIRLGVHPKMMEHLSAVDADAIATSLKMVDAAEIYIGVIAHRYGYIPAGSDISITEMEYNRAAKKGIPCLLFLAAEDIPTRGEHVDEGAAAEKLKQLKDRMKSERVVKFFRDPMHLREEVILSLTPYVDFTPVKRSFLNPIPEPSTPYVAHQYTLLQTPDLIGREYELGVLSDWVVRPERFNDARILSVVGLGGAGKSALTWKWFSDVATKTVHPLAGRLWWSFYDPDATFDEFVTRALAYVSRHAIDDIAAQSLVERERMLLAALDCEPFVLVLDGLERALIGYARSDASRLLDTDVDYTLAKASVTLPQSPLSAPRQHRQLRRAADPRAGKFLRSLARVNASRILISTRLHPADLELLNGDPVPGAFAYELRGLVERDAIALWRAYGATGDPATMIPLFQRFDSHPLLIQALANEVINFRPTPGDFNAWREAHPEFDPFRIPLEEVKAHVLQAALRGLAPAALRTLQLIAAFRMPARFDTLAAVLVRRPQETARPRDYDVALGSFGDVLGDYAQFDEDHPEEAPAPRSPAPYETIAELDHTLAELEGRGVLGWDRRANLYDLHPITRAAVWAGLAPGERRTIHDDLRAHFEALPRFEQKNVNTLEDLALAIELFRMLCGVERYPEATRLYKFQLHYLEDIEPRLTVELLNELFQRGRESLNIEGRTHAYLLNSLGRACRSLGRPDLLVETMQSSLELLNTDWDRVYPLCDLASEACTIGNLFAAEATARRALAAGRAADPQWLQPVGLLTLARCLAFRDAREEAMIAINRSQIMFQRRAHWDWAARARVLGLQLLLWGNFPLDVLWVARGTIEELVKHGFSASAASLQLRLVQAAALVRMGFPDSVEGQLEQALGEAHSRYWVDEELSGMIALAELRRRQAKRAAAGLLLQSARELAERGRYRLRLADIENTSGRLAMDEGEPMKAVSAAIEAYRLSWCDGPPFTYAWGLNEAARQLAACGAKPPDDLAPFDKAKHPEMPTVKINPADEWYIDEDEYKTSLIGSFGNEESQSTE